MNDPTPSRARRRRASIRSTDPALVLAALRDPRALARAGLHDLVNVLTRARGRAFGLGGGVTRPAAEQATNALVALAVVRVLLDQLAADRWPWARDALTIGASLVDVADALGLEVIEVHAGLRSWADRQLEGGQLDSLGYDMVLALLTGGEA